MNQCPCSKHECKKVDDYVIENNAHCEDCFRDCLEITEEYN